MKNLSNIREPIVSYDLFEIGRQTCDDSTNRKKKKKKKEASFLWKIR